MKIKLIKDGGFTFLKGRDFPIYLEAEQHPYIDDAVSVDSSVLLNHGADDGVMILGSWTFTSGEFEFSS